MLRQWEFPADARIQDPQLDSSLHFVSAALGGNALDRAAGRRGGVLRGPRLGVPSGGGRREAIKAMSWRATSIFGPRATSILPPGQMTVSALSSQSNAIPSPTWLAAIMSSFLRFNLIRAFSSTSLVSAAKPTTYGPLGHIRDRLDDVGRGLEIEFDGDSLLLDLLLRNGHRLKIGHCRRRDEYVGIRHLAVNRSVHIASAFHIDARDAAGVGNCTGPVTMVTCAPASRAAAATANPIFPELAGLVR